MAVYGYHAIHASCLAWEALLYLILVMVGSESQTWQQFGSAVRRLARCV